VSNPFLPPDGWEETWSQEDKDKWNAELEQEEYRLGVKERPWRKLARNKQLPPNDPKHRLDWVHPQTGELFHCNDPKCQAGELDDDWAIWLWMAARGTGKTWVGANWVLEMALNNPGIEVGVCGPDYGHVRRVCFEDTKSGILRQARNAGYPVEEYYNRNNLEIKLPNTSIITGMSAEREDSPRGHNLSFVWFDELCQIKNESFYHDSLMPALREDDARLLVTTTPNRTRIIRQLKENAKDPAYKIHITGAPTRENPKFSPHRLMMLENQYKGTMLFKQELEGELLDDIAGALFTLDRIAASRLKYEDLPINRVSTVVAIDPANTSNERSDETGIVCAVQGDDGHAYIVADRSMRGTPEECMRAAVALYNEWNADMIVAEKNGVGDYIDEALKHVNPNIALRKIHAMKGKFLRAQPVSMLMDQGRIHHVGVFDKLEDQLCSVTADSDRSALHDDRADAYVYAITALKLSDISWTEVYGMRTCDCGFSFPEIYTSCRNCGKGFPAPVKTDEDKPKGEVRAWAAAYVKRCPDCGDVYAKQYRKCPKCHQDPTSYMQQVLQMTGQNIGPSAGFRTQGLAGIWKRGI
jgi:phage terminase large subunit-like protein